MSLPSFTIAGNALELLGNVDVSGIVANGLGGATLAKVTFVSNVPANRFITWDDDNLIKVGAVVAQVGSDGAVLREGEAVQLLANDVGLGGFTGTISWTVTIGGMQPFTFTAPGVGETITLKQALSGSSAELNLDGGTPPDDGSGGDIDGGTP
jgi:hypothetical protein